ncbi:MAG: formate dehydrogenase accessory protein FdhE [Anaerolineae bacterium]
MVRDEGQILASLERGEAESAELGAVYALHLAVRRVQAAARNAIGTGQVVSASASAADAMPLTFDDLRVDPGLLLSTATRLAEVIGSGAPGLSEDGAGLTADECLAEGRAWYESRLPPAESAATSPEGVVIAHALVPWLEAADRGRSRPGETVWRQPTCPVCGGYPDLALLTPDNGERRLVCGRCSTEWGYRRLGCPFCKGGEREADVHHEGFTAGDRLYLCGACGAYLKTIDLRQRGAPVVAQYERVRLLPLDIAAQREGYRPGFAVALGTP